MRSLLVVAVVAAAGAGSALAASAPTVPTVTCSAMPTQTPFSQFGDTNNYFLIPGGSMEAPLDGWTLTGGATRTAGNESFFLNAKTDAWSLSLPAGASATTPVVCVDVSTALMRLVVKGVGSSAKLKISLLYTDTTGKAQSIEIDKLEPGRSWSPSQGERFSKTIWNLVKSSTAGANVQFRFSADSSGGAVAIDDVYLDPRKSH